MFEAGAGVWHCRRFVTAAAAPRSVRISAAARDRWHNPRAFRCGGGGCFKSPTGWAFALFRAAVYQNTCSRPARRFMSLEEGYSNPTTLSDLGTSKALLLLALEPVERDKFIEQKHEVNGAGVCRSGVAVFFSVF